MSKDEVRSLLMLVADLINRVGFPIVVCIFLGWLCIFKLDGTQAVVVDALDRNTAAINNLAGILQKGRK